MSNLYKLKKLIDIHEKLIEILKIDGRSCAINRFFGNEWLFMRK